MKMTDTKIDGDITSVVLTIAPDGQDSTRIKEDRNQTDER